MKARNKAAAIAQANAAANSAHEYGGYSTGNTAAGPGSASQAKLSASSKGQRKHGGMYSTHQQKQQLLSHHGVPEQMQSYHHQQRAPEIMENAAGKKQS